MLSLPSEVDGPENVTIFVGKPLKQSKPKNNQTSTNSTRGWLPMKSLKNKRFKFHQPKSQAKGVTLLMLSPQKRASVLCSMRMDVQGMPFPAF